VLSVIDLDTRYLPDDITLPLLWLGIVLNIFNIFTDINSSILGAVFGYGILWIVYFVFKLITGKIGMGHGDFKLLAVFGAWFGWQNLAPIIILSSITAILVATFLIINKSYDKNKGIPFGPYLAFAGWISMILGPYIISVYLNAVM
jgi:leader peptidase (prepilin peptidase)/N-methyltransferase